MSEVTILSVTPKLSSVQKIWLQFSGILILSLELVVMTSVHALDLLSSSKRLFSSNFVSHRLH
jgi:hypothetical protein